MSRLLLSRLLLVVHQNQLVNRYQFLFQKFQNSFRGSRLAETYQE